MKHPNEIPNLVYADSTGQIFDCPGLKMAGRSGRVFHPLEPLDLIPLPQGSELFVLPGRIPVGWDDVEDEMIALEQNPEGSGDPVQAVAAFMAPAYTQTALAAYVQGKDPQPPLPLFAYTAVGWMKGRFWVAGFRSDPDTRQDIRNFSVEQVRKKTLAKLRRSRKNRLVQHLGKCSLTYGCPAAKNYFLGRWEAPLPTSPTCNARCLGCLSCQPESSLPSTQERIRFVPSVDEVAEVAVPHLKHAKKAVVSFGQGCEGEPLLQGELLRDSIRRIRSETSRGTVNLNTNASRPDVVEELIAAGLDSIRISMNSVRSDYYHAYYRPRGYSQEDVLSSWRLMKKAGRFVSLNIFVMPGITDEVEEIERLSGLIDDMGLDLIQLRNHNIDPVWYQDKIDYRQGARTGVRNMVKILKKRFPHLRFGYFNPPLNG